MCLNLLLECGRGCDWSSYPACERSAVTSYKSICHVDACKFLMLFTDVKQEGAVGLLKGTGKSLVGLLVRPAGGLIDLTSGTLAFVAR